MGWEVAAAAIVGLGALWLVLQPLLFPQGVRPAPYEPPEPGETRRGQALTALKEIEFDRATGKLSDADYQELVRRYTAEALAALRSEEAAVAAGPHAPAPASAPPAEDEIEALIAARVTTLRAPAGASGAVPAGTPLAGGALTCGQCGLRPEPDAVFCSSCGGRLAPGCVQCGALLPPDGHFCERCGSRVAA